MTAVGKHSGTVAESPPQPRVGLLVGAVLLTALAWLVLVYYAIRLGPSARSGEPGAWVLLVVATIGAIGCLFLTMVLGGRLVEVVRGPARPPSPPGGRRARR